MWKTLCFIRLPAKVIWVLVSPGPGTCGTARPTFELTRGALREMELAQKDPSFQTYQGVSSPRHTPGWNSTLSPAGRLVCVGGELMCVGGGGAVGRLVRVCVQTIDYRVKINDGCRQFHGQSPGQTPVQVCQALKPISI